MKIIRWTIAGLAALQGLLVLGAVLPVARVSAQIQPTTPAVQQPAAEVVYKYVAQNGDSYSLMARKAVQTYGLKNKITMSQAQIIFAETNVTIAAGSPVLNLGQTLEMKESTIKDWVEKAAQLTPAQQAPWNVYAALADFNTNNVGEAR